MTTATTYTAWIRFAGRQWLRLGTTFPTRQAADAALEQAIAKFRHRNPGSRSVDVQVREMEVHCGTVRQSELPAGVPAPISPAAARNPAGGQTPPKSRPEAFQARAQTYEDDR